MRLSIQKTKHSLALTLLMATLFLSSAYGQLAPTQTLSHSSRSISSVDSTKQQLQEILNSLLTIETPAYTKSYTLGLKNSIKDILSDNKVNVVLKSVELPKNQTARLYLSDKTTGFFLDVHHRKNLDVVSAVYLEKYLNNLFDLHTSTPLRFQELLVNASNLDLDALMALAKIKLHSSKEAAADLSHHLHYEGNLNYIDNETRLLEEKIKTLKNHQIVRSKKQAIEVSTKKAILAALDKATEEGQLRQLIAKNDRKAVAKIIEHYLPWEKLNSVERTLWKEHLNVIANPLPITERVLIYRGIDGDQIYEAYRNGKYLSTAEAIKNADLYLMSPMLSKGKGSWNKRLRHLSELDNHVITKHNNSSEFTKANRLSALFYNHSRDPKGSPLLSVTPSYLVSNLFGGERNTLMAVDPRSIYFNYTSLFIEEHEFFMPLFTFPDEMLAVYDENVHPEVSNPNQHLIKRAKIKLALLTQVNPEEVYIRLINNGKKRFGHTANAIFKEKRYQDEAMMKLFKRSAAKGIYTPDLKEKIKTLPATCQESIRSFFRK